jgi:hypothetical protein
VGLAERIENAIAAARLAAEDAERQTEPAAPPRERGIGFLALGSRWQPQMLSERIMREKTQPQITRRIVVISSKDVELYQLGQIITEHLPFDIAGSDDALLYAARKLESVADKWNLSALHALDDEAQTALERLKVLAPGIADLTDVSLRG